MLDLIKIGAQLQSLRLQNNLSQEQLSEKLYVSHQAISRWETGKSLPTIETLLKLTELYETPIDALLCLDMNFEHDLDSLFSKHSRMAVIDHVLQGHKQSPQLEDVLHRLSQEERFYVIRQCVERQDDGTLERLWSRFSYEERRMIIEHYLTLDHKQPLNNVWYLLAPFEKEIMMKAGKK